MNEIIDRLGQVETPEIEELRKRLTATAGDRGLLDVAYSTVDSPLGELLVAVTPRGLVRIAYGASERADDVLEELAAKVSPRILEDEGRLDAVRRELDEYFERQRSAFDIPLDWSLSHGFTRKVLRATARVPFGALTTYREVARRAGNERAYRAAGNALGANPIPIVVPCHRVVLSGGGLGGYTGGLERKNFLLTIEGALEGS